MLLLLLQQAWAQCASCKAAAATTDESGELVVGGGLNTGILYLLALPFVAIGVIFFVWYLKSKRLKENLPL